MNSKSDSCKSLFKPKPIPTISEEKYKPSKKYNHSKKLILFPPFTKNFNHTATNLTIKISNLSIPNNGSRPTGTLPSVALKSKWSPKSWGIKFTPKKSSPKKMVPAIQVTMTRFRKLSGEVGTAWPNKSDNWKSLNKWWTTKRKSTHKRWSLNNPT